MRPTTAQLFYKKSIRLAPYNQAEIGLIITLEADPDLPVDATQLGEALAPAWAQVQAFVHAQEDVAIERYITLNPQELTRPRRNGRAEFTPVAHEVTDSQADRESAERAAWEAEARADPQPAQPESGVPEGDSPSPPGEPDEGGPPAAVAGQPAGQPTEAAPPPEPPKTPEEAQRRYFARYIGALGGDGLEEIRAFLADPNLGLPTDVDAWVALATRTRDEVKSRAAAEVARGEAELEEKRARARKALADAEAKAATKAPTLPAPARRSPRPTPQS